MHFIATPFALALLGIVIALVSYTNYFLHIFKGKTRPRAFSWFIWGILAAIAFAAQLDAGAGLGAYITGFTSVVCFVIATVAYLRCGRETTRFDWFALAGALFALIILLFTKDPLAAVVLVTVIDIFGFLPSLRHGFYKPREEAPMTFGLNALKFAVSILALGTYTLTTVLYPASLVCMNALLFCILISRRNSKHRAR